MTDGAARLFGFAQLLKLALGLDFTLAFPSDPDSGEPLCGPASVASIFALLKLETAGSSAEELAPSALEAADVFGRATRAFLEPMTRAFSPGGPYAANLSRRKVGHKSSTLNKQGLPDAAHCSHTGSSGLRLHLTFLARLRVTERNRVR